MDDEQFLDECSRYLNGGSVPAFYENGIGSKINRKKTLGLVIFSDMPESKKQELLAE